MFTEQGLDRHRVLGGRGRSPEPVIVHFDSRYPIDLINQILNEVKQALSDDDKYQDWVAQSELYSKLTRECDSELKLEAIDKLMDRYLSESNNTPHWDKANKLLIELQQILGGNHDKTI